jgi:aminopeptidase N
MASYLATVTTGYFELEQTDAGGIPSYTAVDPLMTGRPTLDLQGRIARSVDILGGLLGSYPFDATGAIVDFVPGIFYAHETQTRPVFPFAPDDEFLVHELAHEWFGNSVSVSRWRDIWLNEGFATWSEWYFREVSAGEPASGRFDQLYETPPEDAEFWTPPPGNPGGPDLMFDDTIYQRGAMAVQALRQTIGERKFQRLLRAWVRIHRHGNASTRDFIDLAEAKADRQLDRFFAAWLFEPAKPAESFVG